MRISHHRKRLLLFLPASCAFVLLAIRSREAAAAAQAGMEACLQSVAPSLFPFLVLGNILMEIGFPASSLRFPGRVFERVFHIRREAFNAFLIGLLGGFPLGAVAAAQAYRKGLCSSEEAERLMIFSDNCSPGFLFGLVGSRALGSFGAPLLLLSLQWGVSVWLGILLGLGKCPSSPGDETADRLRISFPAILTRAVASGARSLLLICAYVVFFDVVCSCLPSLPLLRGAMELTGGILLCSGPADLPIAAFLLGWGGLSAAFQVFAAALEAGIPISRYLPLRLLHASFMALFILCLRKGALFLPIPLTAAASIAIFVKMSRNRRLLRV